MVRLWFWGRLRLASLCHFCPPPLFLGWVLFFPPVAISCWEQISPLPCGEHHCLLCILRNRLYSTILINCCHLKEMPCWTEVSVGGLLTSCAAHYVLFGETGPLFLLLCDWLWYKEQTQWGCLCSCHRLLCGLYFSLVYYLQEHPFDLQGLRVEMRSV